MTSQQWTLGIYILGWQLAGCGLGVGEDVLLGRTTQAPLSASDGQTTNYGQSRGFPETSLGPLPETTPPTALVEVATPLSCDSQSHSELTLDFLVPAFLGTDCPFVLTPEVCNHFNPEHIVVLADGSAWVVGNLTPIGPSRFRALHIGADGTVLAAREDEGYVTSLTADDRGVAWLLVRRAQGMFLQRLSGTAESLGTLLPAADRSVAVAALPEHGVIVASAGGELTVTLLDYDGQLAWSRVVSTKREDNVALVVGATEFAVLTTLQLEAAYSRIVADRFSFAGETLGQESSQVNLATGFFTYYFKYAYDKEGQLILAVLPPDPETGAGLEDTLDIERIDLTGSSRSSVRIENVSPSNSTLSPSGDLWFQSYGGNGSAAIGRVTNAGTVCEKLGEPDAAFVALWAAAPDGRIWFVDYRGIGRLTLQRD